MSVSIYEWDSKKEKKELIEIAKDLRQCWLTSIELINDNYIFCSDNKNNVFTLFLDRESVKNAKTQFEANPESKKVTKIKLRLMAKMHLGESINVMRVGSLVKRVNNVSMWSMGLDEKYGTIGTPILFGTVSGAIGCVFTITRELYEVFYHLQNMMTKYMTNIGNLDHRDYRSYRPFGPDSLKSEDMAYFIDGDF